MKTTADTPETARRPYAKTEQVLTTITPETLAELDKAAAYKRVSRAELIRTFIADGLTDHDATTG